MEEVRRSLGLDRSLTVQFGLYVRDLARGNLGNSLSTGQPVVQELLQDALHADALANELQRLMEDEPYREAMQGAYDALEQKLGGPGASQRVAIDITTRLGLVKP